jgi:hypothetical protein
VERGGGERSEQILNALLHFSRLPLALLTSILTHPGHGSPASSHSLHGTWWQPRVWFLSTPPRDVEQPPRAAPDTQRDNVFLLAVAGGSQSVGALSPSRGVGARVAHGDADAAEDDVAASQDPVDSGGSVVRRVLDMVFGASHDKRD